LVRGLLAAKTQVYEGWKSLDFLGFSRPNWAFSMGYAGFSLKEKSSALSRDGGGVGRSASVFGEEKRGIAHETSLSHFLIFCN
jgi:hypothetical protein